LVRVNGFSLIAVANRWRKGKDYAEKGNESRSETTRLPEIARVLKNLQSDWKKGFFA
jgi:hypothetical protein